MPTISMFYGIIIRMYCAPREHNPPHIQKCEVTEGKLPNNKLRIVLAWVEIRKEELMADWTLA